MSAVKDMTGHRFGQLQVLKRAGSSPTGQAIWKCLCDCGRVCIANGNHMRTGNTQSCGCSRVTHGMTRRKIPWHPLYQTWRGMWQRCTNAKRRDFKYYGGRGIKVCARWNDFALFVADMGPRPEGTTLDRRRNNGNYTPGNCRWATHKEQSSNKRKKGR